MLPPQYIWIDPHGQGVNVFALFRRSFRLTEVPETCPIHLFADTRYRLWVNGEIVGYGPARFHPSHPEFDSFDLAPNLRVGANGILVEANAFGASSFEAEPSVGGFIAWGGTGSVDFVTPGEWRARTPLAWDPDAPAWSFAQGPVEIFDARRFDESWRAAETDDSAWDKPVRHLRPDQWGALAPRSIPGYDYRLLSPAGVQSYALTEPEEIVGFRLSGVHRRSEGKNLRTAYVLIIHSPHEQLVPVGTFWGPHYVNGQEVKGENDQVLGNRQNATYLLRAGDNLVYGEIDYHQEGWSYLLGLPKDRGLTVGPVRVSPLYPVSELRRRIPQPPVDGLDNLDVPWQIVDSPIAIAPARRVGWDRISEHQAGASAVVADFQREFIGHSRIDVEAPAGTVLDITVDEVLRPDGLAPTFRGNPFIGNTDRIILSGGRTTVEVFRPRGGRYVMATLRTADPAAQVHAIQVRQTLADIPRVGTYASGDAFLDWLWEAGAHTTEASTEDAFVDPWRERGVYVGDTIIEHLVARALSPDDSVTKRCLRLWAQGQRADGFIQNCTPSWLDHPHIDFTYLYVLLLLDFVRYTNDLDLVRELWPTVPKALFSPVYRRGATGLIDATPHHAFIDWAIPQPARNGESAAVNAFAIAAAEAAAELAGKIGEDPGPYQDQAAHLRESFAALWNPDLGRYDATRIDGARSEVGPLHGNVLALLYRIVPPENEPAALAYVLDRLHHPQEDDRIEIYFQYFALQTLLDRQLYKDAERLLRSAWRTMFEAQTLTLWEASSWGPRAYGSFCHGWAASPTWFLSAYGLGVQPEPQNPDCIAIRPTDFGVTAMRGVFPHRRGPVHIDWHREGDHLELSITKPAGVEIGQIAPQGALADLEVQLKMM
jgi:alpha-L-rhamnosidase